jgi:hypothetical protein
MPQYLLYCFQGQQFVRCDKFFAPDDEAAIEGALTRHDGGAAELWRGKARIKRFEHAPPL